MAKKIKFTTTKLILYGFLIFSLIIILLFIQPFTLMGVQDTYYVGDTIVYYVAPTKESPEKAAKCNFIVRMDNPSAGISYSDTSGPTTTCVGLPCAKFSYTFPKSGTYGLVALSECPSGTFTDSKSLSVIEKKPECVSHAYTKCAEGNRIMWFDSCGKQEDVYKYCSIDQRCIGNSCEEKVSEDCNAFTRLECSGADLIVTKNACGQIIHKEYCPGGTRCAGNPPQCIKPEETVKCNDGEVSSKGCASTEKYSVTECVNGEWVINSLVCLEGQVCSEEEEGCVAIDNPEETISDIDEILTYANATSTTGEGLDTVENTYIGKSFWDKLSLTSKVLLSLIILIVLFGGGYLLTQKPKKNLVF